MTGSTKATVALTTTLATDPVQATLPVTATPDMATMDSPVNATVDTPTTMVASDPLLLLKLHLVLSESFVHHRSG